MASVVHAEQGLRGVMMIEEAILMTTMRTMMLMMEGMVMAMATVMETSSDQ
jgi:hypothetical protein